MVDERDGAAVRGRRVELAGEQRRDALAVEDAQFDGAGRDRLEADWIEAAIGAQNAKAGAEPLFGMRPAGEHGADQPFGVRPDLAGPSAEPIRRPLGVAPVGAGRVIEVIEGLDLRAMSGAYRGSGSASYHPTMLLGLLVYGYATGVFSSRKLERATYDSVAFRFIAANDHPDHDTIAAFRRRFLKEIEALFVQVLLLAREMGVLKMGTVALDGEDPRQRQPA